MAENDGGPTERGQYELALERLGWERLDRIPELHDAVAPSAAVVHHVRDMLSKRTFADLADAALVTQTSAICAACWVLEDLSVPVTPDSPDHHQPPGHTGWWIVDLGPFPETVEPTVYRATCALDPALVPAGGRVPWTVMQCSRNDEAPGEQKMTLLMAMKIDRTIYPWGCRREYVKRFPKDKGGRWVYRAPGSVQVKAEYNGVPTQATPSVELIVTEYGPEPANDGSSLGEQAVMRTGQIKLDFVKALGEGREKILEITDKASELAALARSALSDPVTAGDLVTALTDDRYDPPRPGKTRIQEVVLAVCDASPVLDMLQQLTY